MSTVRDLVAAMQRDDPFIKRAFRKVDITTTCWLWTGFRDKRGYGQIRRGARGAKGTKWVHRAIYEVLIAAVPSGLHLHHLCRVTNCVNPEHLEPVTSREHVFRGNTIARMNIEKTHCKHGHPFSGNTLIVGTDSKGRSFRDCRTCKQKRWRKWAALSRRGVTSETTT